MKINKVKNTAKESKDCENSLESMSDFFEARSEIYEEHMKRWEKHYILMSELLPESISTLLDLGCGSGLELDYIFNRFPSLEVTGIDLCEKMLEKLRKKHADKKLNIIKGDYFSVPFNKDYFDAAVSFETLHHYDAVKKTELFKKILNSLKAGGVYIECDYVADTQEAEEENFKNLAEFRKKENISDEVLVHFDTPLTLDNEIRSIKNAGFSSVEFKGYICGDNNTAVIVAIK